MVEEADEVELTPEEVEALIEAEGLPVGELVAEDYEEETDMEREMLPKMPEEEVPSRPKVKRHSKSKASTTQLQELLPLE